jgi:hypothetical protein
MTDRRMATLALVLVVIVGLLLLVHVIIPTPPAHRWDPFNLGSPDLRLS